MAGARAARPQQGAITTRTITARPLHVAGTANDPVSTTWKAAAVAGGVEGTAGARAASTMRRKGTAMGRGTSVAGTSVGAVGAAAAVAAVAGTTVRAVGTTRAARRGTNGMAAVVVGTNGAEATWVTSEGLWERAVRGEATGAARRGATRLARRGTGLPVGEEEQLAVPQARAATVGAQLRLLPACRAAWAHLQRWRRRSEGTAGLGKLLAC